MTLLSSLSIPLGQLWLDTPPVNASHALLDIKVFESPFLLFDAIPDYSNFVDVPWYLSLDTGACVCVCVCVCACVLSGSMVMHGVVYTVVCIVPYSVCFHQHMSTMCASYSIYNPYTHSHPPSHHTALAFCPTAPPPGPSRTTWLSNTLGAVPSTFSITSYTTTLHGASGTASRASTLLAQAASSGQLQTWAGVPLYNMAMNVPTMLTASVWETCMCVCVCVCEDVCVAVYEIEYMCICMEYIHTHTYT